MTAAVARRLWARLGRRGSALLATGLGWIAYGAGIVVWPRYGVSRGVTILTHLMPLPWYGAVWIICGTAAVIAAWMRPGRDGFGFGLATAPPIMWALAYVWAGVSGDYSVAWASIPAWLVPGALLSSVAALSRRLVDITRQHADTKRQLNAALEQLRQVQRERSRE